ncbi:hypothetical protein OsI_38211 [Oryza sativa Indica Group]|uniref:VWFA domain-containing protein n=1 Tax=Oryza sativa subsp. indica TaxID=39946 RepID=B8BPG6_ORYSI|nr:hypothetical protein OsI_38211 [Oryza sativa Indica Group]
MKRQGFIVLVSDRDSSMSNCSDDGLLQKYPVHTFSLGKAEDPTELVTIAKESKGTFSSISGNSKIMEAFAICLAGLKSVIAVNARVKISPKESANTSNVKVYKPVGINDTDFRMERDNEAVALGVLYAGEVKDLIVGIEFTVEDVKGFRSIDVLTATVEYYKDVQQEQLPKSTAKCTMQQMARFDVLLLMAEIRGKLDAVKKKKEDGIMLPYEAWRMLKSRWEESKNSDEYFYSWRQAQRVGVDLGRIENDIHAMVSCLKRGLGLGCVYSWVSSYQMQRATTTGLPTTSSFLTPAMEDMVHQARKQSEKDAAATSAAGGGTRMALRPGEARIVEVLEQIAKRLEDVETKLDHRGEPSRNPHRNPTTPGM